MATTTEHAPPKCFFPEIKDVGRDVRKDLITVPSCPEHNTHRSQDDEYVMLLVVTYFETNDLARNQFQTKCIRALKHSGGLLTRILTHPREVNVLGRSSGAVDVDRRRFDRVMDHTCRALYWHRTSKRLEATLAIWSPVFRTENLERFAPYTEQAFNARRLLTDASKHGANPMVFWYQMHETAGAVLFRLHYYEGVSVYALTLP